MNISMEELPEKTEARDEIYEIPIKVQMQFILLLLILISSMKTVKRLYVITNFSRAWSCRCAKIQPTFSTQPAISSAHALAQKPKHFYNYKCCCWNANEKGSHILTSGLHKNQLEQPQASCRRLPLFFNLTFLCPFG
jgi:hypothetical protein